MCFVAIVALTAYHSTRKHDLRIGTPVMLANVMLASLVRDSQSSNAVVTSCMKQT